MPAAGHDVSSTSQDGRPMAHDRLRIRRKYGRMHLALSALHFTQTPVAACEAARLCRSRYGPDDSSSPPSMRSARGLASLLNAQGSARAPAEPCCVSDDQGRWRPIRLEKPVDRATAQDRDRAGPRRPPGSPMPERAEERQRGTAPAGAPRRRSVGRLLARERGWPSGGTLWAAWYATAAEGAATRRGIRQYRRREPRPTRAGAPGACRRAPPGAAARSAGAPLFSCHCAGGDHPAEWRRSA